MKLSLLLGSVLASLSSVLAQTCVVGTAACCNVEGLPPHTPSPKGPVTRSGDIVIMDCEPLYQQSATGATSGKTCNQHLVCCRFQKIGAKNVCKPVDSSNHP